jgi:hypothetical protein
LESIAAVEYFKWPAVIQEQLRVIENALKENTKYILDSEVMNLIKKVKIG